MSMCHHGCLFILRHLFCIRSTKGMVSVSLVSLLQVQLFPPFAWSDPSNTPHQKTCCVCVLYHHPFRSVRLIKLCTSSFFLSIDKPVSPIVMYCFHPVASYHSRTLSGLRWIGQSFPIRLCYGYDPNATLHKQKCRLSMRIFEVQKNFPD